MGDFIARGLAVNGSSSSISSVSSINGRTGIVNIDKTDVGLANVTNDSQVKRTEMGASNGVATLDANSKLVQMPDASDIGLSNVDNVQQIPMSYLGTTNGVAPLNANGKVDSTYLTFVGSTIKVVANITERLALSSSENLIIAIQSDTNWIWGLNSSLDPSLPSNWTDMGSAASNVVSVNGATGAVTINKTTVGLGNVDNTSDLDKPISDDTQDALDEKLDIVDSPTILDWSPNTIVRSGEVRKCTTSYGTFSSNQLIRSLSERTTGTVFGTTEITYWESFGSGSSGGGVTSIQSISSSGDVAAWIYTVLADCSSGLITATLPSASGVAGKFVEIIKYDNSVNPVLIKPYGSELLNGSNSGIYLYNQWESVFIRSDGTNTYVVEDSRTTIYAQASYMRGYRSDIQDTSVTANAPVIFTDNISSGSDITLDTSTGIFTLKANKTYKLDGSVGELRFSGDGYARFQWYDITNSTYVGTACGGDNVASTLYVLGGGIATHVFTPSVDTQIALYQISSSNLSSYGYVTSLPWAMIEVISQPAPVLNTSDYCKVIKTTNTAYSTNGVIKFDYINSSSGIIYDASTGYFTLHTGKTYSISGFGTQIDATKILRMQWYDITNSVYLASGTMNAVSAESSGGDSGSMPIIITPTQNIEICLRMVSGAGTLGGNQTWALIQQIGSTATSTVPSSLIDTSNGLNVNGFTKLGSSAPAIKTKKIIGTLPSEAAYYKDYAIGTTGNKILDVQIFALNTGGAFVPPFYLPENNSKAWYYSYKVESDGDLRVITNQDSTDAILSATFTALITYEE